MSSKTHLFSRQIDRSLSTTVNDSRVEKGPGRVLFVTPRYFPHIGGVENHVYQVASRLRQFGIDTTVLTADSSGRLPSREIVDGIHIRRVRSWPSREDFYFAPDIYRIITKEHWDIVHVQSYHTLVAPLAMFAAWQANIPYIVTFHGGGHSSRFRHSLRGVQQWMLRPLLIRATRLVAVAQFEVSHFGRRLRIPLNKFTFIPNGADLPNISEDKRETVDENLIVSLGRLERYKGHHRVIEAMPDILAQRPDVRLWIAGEGPYKSHLLDLARKLGVDHRVEIRAIPGTERDRMARELSRAALVILLSEYETHPIAVLEALALGRPVLVADTSGLSELAQSGLARAIPLKSSSAQIAEAAIHNLGQPSQAGNIDIATWDECCAGLLSLYKEISRGTICAS